mmetsp:Transcript_132659/g.383548  ORF Transcript_132659/g.383548 Transcript_132659/m.383548 type:complete len:352 (-) Transcript_132659:191-1246(-)
MGVAGGRSRAVADETAASALGGAGRVLRGGKIALTGDDYRLSGPNKDSRELLDYGYHERYGSERIALQDRIIDKLFPVRPSRSEDLQWVVFTAGAMGAGKGFVTRWMHDQQIWDLERFVKVDPDEVRHELPEWEEYVKSDPQTAGDRTQKEAGFVAEIIGYKALRERRNVIVDGSLRNAEWYKGYFAKLRRLFPGIRIMILHVVADLPDVLERAAQRAMATGRVVPRDRLISSAGEVPSSVRALAPHADFVCRVLNGPGRDPEVAREVGAPHPSASVPITWDLVRKLWRPAAPMERRQPMLLEARATIAEESLFTQRVGKALGRARGRELSKLERVLVALSAMPLDRRARS